jgi:rubrerythrin
MNIVGICNLLQGGMSIDYCIENSYFELDDMQEMRSWLKRHCDTLREHLKQTTQIRDGLVEDINHYNDICKLYKAIDKRSFEMYQIAVEEIVAAEGRMTKLRDSITKCEELVSELTKEVEKQKSHKVIFCDRCGTPLSRERSCPRCNVPILFIAH